MPKFTFEVYRPRLERTTVTVTAKSEYDATELAFKKSDTLPPEAWKMTPETIAFYCGHDPHGMEKFIPDEDSIIPGSDQPGYVDPYGDDDD